MFIAVSTGDCRIAVKAALEGFQATLAGDRETIRNKSFEALHAGAVHNGLKPSQHDIDQMNRMADSDVEHMLEQHPAHRFIEHCENLLDMLDYTTDDAVLMDDQDFRLLKKHLPAKE